MVLQVQNARVVPCHKTAQLAINRRCFPFPVSLYVSGKYYDNAHSLDPIATAIGALFLARLLDPLLSRVHRPFSSSFFCEIVARFLVYNSISTAVLNGSTWIRPTSSLFCLESELILVELLLLLLRLLVVEGIRSGALTARHGVWVDRKRTELERRKAL